MFNAGCFSLPYAWRLGGLWVSFVLSFVIAGFNWYGNHILVKSSQHLAKKSERSSLDYGHFAKKILPVENKLETPDDFLNNFGVLPTTMILCAVFMVAIGFYGYTAFGDKTQAAITMNVPKEGLYSTINVFLMLQSMLGHSIAMYVILDMFFNGFRRKFAYRFPNCPKIVVDKGFRIFWVMVTFLMAVSVPHLEIMIPLVGVTSGTLCALIYPPIFEMITFWNDWKVLFDIFFRYLYCVISSLLP
ncbi:unnamed protein product [Anisakis simplex]|uniref:Putative amino acid permease (inferred by orthology to a C. elegans protein) n=1 Tax=Anisakis simplex TaxID=6269 RepID=A0A0M3JYJ8_ANISI|nr:unnamed protein product [Anisakis simplex]